MQIYLRRVTFNETSPTYGVLLNDTAPLCVTLELPWQGNAPMISCIPPGTYQCTLIPATAELNYPHYAVNNVPNRSDVRIHVGNTTADVKGCIAVGEYFGTNGILQSTDAMNFLRATLPTSFPLTIINP